MVEELEQDTNNEGNEDAILNDDVEMDVQFAGRASTRLFRCQCCRVEKFFLSDTNEKHNHVETKFDHEHCGCVSSDWYLYDLSELKDRNRAAYRLCSEKPYVLITSPLNTSTSEANYLRSREHQTENRSHRKPEEQLEFICKLIMIQHRNKGYFITNILMMHFRGTISVSKRFLLFTQAKVTKFGQCQLGLMYADTAGSTEAPWKTQQDHEHDTCH